MSCQFWSLGLQLPRSFHLCSLACSPETAVWEASLASQRMSGHVAEWSGALPGQHPLADLRDSLAEGCHLSEAMWNQQRSCSANSIRKIRNCCCVRDCVLGWFLLRNRCLKQTVTTSTVLMTFAQVPRGQLCIALPVLIFKSTD